MKNTELPYDAAIPPLDIYLKELRVVWMNLETVKQNEVSQRKTSVMY